MAPTVRAVDPHESLAQERREGAHAPAFRVCWPVRLRAETLGYQTQELEEALCVVGGAWREWILLVGSLASDLVLVLMELYM
jgi:hypothetical protein